MAKNEKILFHTCNKHFYKIKKFSNFHLTKEKAVQSFNKETHGATGAATSAAVEKLKTN